jgi:hypothetical protein
MDKRLILLGLLFLASHYLIAQEDATQAINDIKRHSDIYLYSESTSQSWEEALDNAKYLLGVEIETWVKTLDTPPADGYVAETEKHIYHLQSMRGDRYRAFVYVKKADISACENASQLVVVPIKEQQTNVQEVTTPSPEPVVAAPHEVRQTENIPAYTPTEFEKEMMSITDANDIGTFIKRLKSEGKIINHGKYKDMPIDINCYLFVYNREMEIPAYLHKQGNNYTNLKTGRQDHVTNYKGCGAMWFQLK